MKSECREEASAKASGHPRRCGSSEYSALQERHRALEASLTLLATTTAAVHHRCITRAALDALLRHSC
jgi:hypothetical protein